MNIIALIHARGGSKRIPLKNIKIIGGKPLIAYPIELAKAIPGISRVIVSTDHPEITRVAKEWGAEVPFKRPADISEDVPSEQVTLHTLNWLNENEGKLPDIVVTLTPATPFTQRSDLEKGIRLLQDRQDIDSVITLRKAREYMEWMVELRDDQTGFTPYGHGFDGKYNVSQNLKPHLYPLGAFFINRVSSFIAKPSMYGERWLGIQMPGHLHVDIDEPEDLIEADKLAQGWKLD